MSQNFRQGWQPTVSSWGEGRVFMLESKWVVYSRSPGPVHPRGKEPGSLREAGPGGGTPMLMELEDDRGWREEEGASVALEPTVCWMLIFPHRQSIFCSIFFMFILQIEASETPKRQGQKRGLQPRTPHPSLFGICSWAAKVPHRTWWSGEGLSSRQLSRACPHRVQHLPYLCLHPGQSAQGLLSLGESPSALHKTSRLELLTGGTASSSPQEEKSRQDSAYLANSQ